MDDITIIESSRLEGCEQVIENGVACFIEVGEALMAIRDSRLYRAEHETFQDYCEKRWGFTRQRAHQFIGAFKVAELASTVVDIPIANEAQARQLFPLLDDPVALAEVLREVHEATNGKPTMATIAAAVEKRKGRAAELERRRVGLSEDAAKRRAEWRTHEVATFLDGLKKYRQSLKLDQYALAKFSSEARSYVVRQLLLTRSAEEQLIAKLSDPTEVSA